MTLLSVVKEVVRVVGVSDTSSIFSNITGNRTMQEMLALANEMAQRIAYDDRDWTQLKLSATLVGDGVTTAFDLPANFKRMLLTANVWRSTSTQIPMRFVPDTDVWMQRRAANYTDGNGEWTIYGGQIHIFPAMGVGVTATFVYIDKNCINVAAGGVGTEFMADGDTFRLDERVLKLGMIWQWKAQKGAAYAEDLGTFGDAIAKAMGTDKPSPIIIGRTPLSSSYGPPGEPVNFNVALQGPQGPPGPQGPAGPQGPQGVVPEAPTDGTLYSRRGSDATWQPSPTGGGGGIAEAPTDSQYYTRRNTTWTAMTYTALPGKPATYPPTLPIAESDVTNLVTDLAAKATTAALSTETTNRTNADTTLQTNINAKIGEAPTDGQSYARRGSDASWQVAGTGGGLADAPSDGTAYGRLSATWAQVLPLAGGTLTGALLSTSRISVTAATEPSGLAAGTVLASANVSSGKAYYHNAYLSAGATKALTAGYTAIADFDQAGGSWVLKIGTSVGANATSTTTNYISVAATGITLGAKLTGSTAKLTTILEQATPSATAATGTINLDALTQSNLFYTTNATANWTINVRASSTVTLNTFMAVNDSVTVAFMAAQGTTAFYNNAFTIDGTAVTPKWQGGAPAAGNVSGIDAYVYTIIKTAASTYTVLASQTQFK
jgi:hypothetical protein